MMPLTQDVKKLITLTDLFLLDIKHINDEKCRALTGVSNKLELEFAKYLSDNNVSMWIRQVLIPSYTDDYEDLIALRDFIRTLNTVQKIEILPYHDMGKYKWRSLGLKYELDNIRNASTEDVERAKKILEI